MAILMRGGTTGQSNGTGGGPTTSIDMYDNANPFGLAQQGYYQQRGLNDQQNAFAGGQNAANRNLQQYLGDQGNATQRYGVDAQAQTAREGNQLQYQASILPTQYKQDRFNTILPMFQSAFGNMGFNGSAGGKAYSGAGQVGTQPGITTGGVFDDNQIQQQVNAGRAANDQKTGGQIQQMRGKLAGQGFGANSPLAAALEQNYQGQNTATNTANERETRMGAATANATQRLNSQTAAENQFASRQGEDIERNKNYRSSLNQWLGTLGGLV